MITISNLSKSYGLRTLFKDINLTINRQEKIGLVGPNGAGKTTLFQVILAKNEASSGHVQINKNIRIGYLPQESNFPSERTVLSEVIEGDEAIQLLVREKEKLEEAHKADTASYGDILHELEAFDYFNLEYKAKQVLSGLGFKEKDFNRPIMQLSGGWQMRVLLAKLLTCHYDLLLLDEPTNYLDLNAALWFKDYLSNFKGTFIMISHDRAFLDEVTNFTFVLENGVVAKVQGNYEHYRQIIDEQRIHLIKQFKEQEKKREQLQEFISRFHAQPNKASQVRAKRSALERMEEIVVPIDYRESIKTFHFPETRPSGQRVIALKNISKFYADIKVYENFDFEIERGEKAVLAGENGAGKSTLLKIIAGVIEINSGERVVGHNVDIGYFSQTRVDVLNVDNTVLEEAYSVAGGTMPVERMRTILGAFLFRGDDVEKHVKVLSGGEKSRLILAKLLLNPPNFLLLDEPTTHLDVDAVDALIKALNEYQGTLVFISHDIHFVRSVANTVYDVKSGHVRKFPGNFDYYLDKKAKGDKVDNVSTGHKSYVHVTSRSGNKNNNIEVEAGDSTILHNSKLSKKIKKLRKEKEKIESERYAKERIVSNSRHGQDIIQLYEMQIKELNKKIVDIDHEIAITKSRFIQDK